MTNCCSIEGDIVPKEGDDVSYKLCTIPPKHEKTSAVHVQIIHLKEGIKHDHWEPLHPPHLDS